MFSILKRIMLTTVIAVGFIISSMTVTAQADMPPTIAESACMIDVDTGKVLYQSIRPNGSTRRARRKSSPSLRPWTSIKINWTSLYRFPGKQPIRNLPVWGFRRAIQFPSAKPCGA